LTRDLRWAGFEIEFRGTKDPDQQLLCSYEVFFTTETPAGSEQDA